MVALQGSDEFKGVQVQGVDMSMAAYTDNLTLTVSNNKDLAEVEKSLPRLQRTLGPA